MKPTPDHGLEPSGSAVGPANLDQGSALAAGTEDLLRCPACRGRLLRGPSEFLCTGAACRVAYPVVGTVPVLVRDDASLFTRADFLSGKPTTVKSSRSRFTPWVDRLLPSLGRNFKARQNYETFARLVLERAPEPVVLIIGGRVAGQGAEALMLRPGIRLLETDLAFGPRTQVVCDAHDLPFGDKVFDGVAIQAVLPYVPDPVRCVQEVERVIKPRGLIYAEAAFMQQVVHGCYDFTRFTHVGLRRLFRGFEELQSGLVGGPGMALAWACHFFLLSFAARKFTRSLIQALSRLTLFWLKYLDAWLLDRPGSYDAASGFFFLGERAARMLSDREVVMRYQGAQ